MRFRVHPEVFEKMPTVFFGSVVARGIDNRSLSPAVEALLDSSIESIGQRLMGANLKEIPEIAVYRDAFQTLGFNPNKYMCSIEALVKRILKGGDFPRISNVVDLGNAISLKYILPMGAHDINAASEDIEIRFAREGDEFIPFGSTEIEAVEPGELVYVRGSSVKTRRWIWRQSDVGKITENSTDIFFPMDGFSDVNKDAVEAAQQELAALLESLFNCPVTTGIVHRGCTEMTL